MVKKYFRKAYTLFATYIYDIPPRMLSFLLFILLMFLPVIGLDMYTYRLLITANTTVIFAVGWDLLVGRTGQMSLGHALFFGIGGYSTALLFQYLGWPLWVTIPISVLVGVGVAVLIGIPCLRLKGPYLALVTMAFPLVLSSLVIYFKDVTRGEMGIRVPTFFKELNYFPDRLITHYYLAIFLMAISCVIVYKIANSKTGIVFVSILDDDLASKACGINVTRYKLAAFAISGLFGSLAGCINVHSLLGKADPSLFSLDNSILPLVVTIIGGLGTVYGPIVGTYFYYLLDGYVLKVLIPVQDWEYLGIDWTYAKLLIFILVVVIFILKWPRGIARTIVEKFEDFEEARSIEDIEKERAKKG